MLESNENTTRLKASLRELEIGLINSYYKTESINLVIIEKDMKTLQLDDIDE